MAPLSTIAFKSMVQEDTEYFGVPLRFMYTPHPVVSMHPSILRGYIEGRDPVTGRRLAEEVLEALTKPYTAEESRNLAIVRPTPERPRLLEANTEDKLQQPLLIERGWTDGLPIVLPTEERVARMLAGTHQPPDKLVGKAFMVDTQENLRITVEMVATAAVMAGARPEHLPVFACHRDDRSARYPTFNPAVRQRPAGKWPYSKRDRHELRDGSAGAL